MAPDWQAGEDRRLAWLSLDASDADPTSFWTYVVTALQATVPGTAPGALELIAASPLPTELVLTALVNDLATTPGEVWLVLDDYHLVDGREVRDGDGVPARPPPAAGARGASAPAPTPNCRCRGGGCAESWSRSGPPTCGSPPTRRPTYLNERRRAGPRPPTSVAVLEQRTEGWIAALQLAALSMRGRDGRRRLHRPVRWQRPLHRRLPRRGGARPPTRPGPRVPAAVRGARPADRPAVRRRHRPRRRQPRCCRPSSAPTSSSSRSTTARVVPLPPPVRRRAAGAAARRAARTGSVAAPARQPLVRASTG